MQHISTLPPQEVIKWGAKNQREQTYLHLLYEAVDGYQSLTKQLDIYKAKALLYDQNLENCTGDAQPQGGAEVLHRQRVCIGYNDDGSPITKQISGHSEIDLADKIVKAMLKSERRSEFIQSEQKKQSRTDFAEYARNCYTTYKEKTLSANSQIREKSSLNQLCRFFEGKYIEDLTDKNVQEWINDRAEDGVTSTTINDQWKVLKWILNCAVDDNLIDKNPAKSKRVKNSGNDSEGTQALPLEEIKRLKKLLPTITDNRIQLALALFLYTGMRREEVLGLMWEDIDFDSNTLHVQRAVTYPVGVPVVKTPKTKAGNRIIPLSDDLTDILRKHRQTSGYVVTDGNGGLFKTDNAYRRFYDRVKAAMDLDVSALIFRRTFATMMISAGVDPKTVQAIMGHEKSQTTMDIYAKVNHEQLLGCRNKLSDYLNCA